MKFSVIRWCALVSLIGICLAGFEAQGGSTLPQKNRVIIYPARGETISQLRQQGIASVDNYGSYWVAEVTDKQLASLSAIPGNRVVLANYLNQIALQFNSIDTANGAGMVPADMQEADTAGRRLLLIQFKGPIQPEWLTPVKHLPNLQIVNYVPNNAYLVFTDTATEKQLEALRVPRGPIQWVGAYHPYYKISSALRQTVGGVDVDV